MEASPCCCMDYDASVLMLFKTRSRPVATSSGRPSHSMGPRSRRCVGPRRAPPPPSAAHRPAAVGAVQSTAVFTDPASSFSRRRADGRSLHHLRRRHPPPRRLHTRERMERPHDGAAGVPVLVRKALFQSKEALPFLAVLLSHGRKALSVHCTEPG